MIIAVQSNRRPNSQLMTEINSLESADVEYVTFGYVRNGNNIKVVGLEHIDKSVNIYSRCTTVFLDKNVNVIGEFPSSFLSSITYDENAFSISNMPESELLINKYPGKYSICQLKDILDHTVYVDTFYKPLNDRKFIPGVIVKRGSTLKTELELNHSTNYSDEELKTLILKSTNILYNIEEEIRCYVVNNKCVTASRYKKCGQYNIDTLSNYEMECYIDAANEFISNVYSPCDNFTIDLAKMSDGRILIVEYNCLNSSGLYSCDSKILFDELEKYLYGSIK